MLRSFHPPSTRGRPVQLVLTEEQATELLVELRRTLIKMRGVFEWKPADES